MKITLRLTLLSLIMSIAFTLYSLSSFFTPVKAFCQTGWNYCVLPDGTRRDGSPGNMSGCSVRSYNPWDNPDLAAYVYTCNKKETTCYYVFKCPSGDQTPEMEEPPQN